MSEAPTVPGDDAAARFACDACGAVLTWDARSFALRCAHCGATHPLPSAPVPAGHDLHAGLADARRGLGTATRRLRCRACGAGLLCATSALTVRCAFCAAHAVVDCGPEDGGPLRRDGGEAALRPDAIVPFAIDRAVAAERFGRWLRRRWLCPGDLSRMARVQAMSGVYLPFWSFTAEVTSHWRAERGRLERPPRRRQRPPVPDPFPPHPPFPPAPAPPPRAADDDDDDGDDEYQIQVLDPDGAAPAGRPPTIGPPTIGPPTVGSRRRRDHRHRRRGAPARLRWEPAHGQRSDRDELLVCASHALPEALLARLPRRDDEPLVSYAPSYLAGWQTEAVALPLPDAWRRARARLESVQRARCAADVGGDTQRRLQVEHRFGPVVFRAVLLPVWVAAYRYRGGVYRFLVSGHTGDVVGEAPWSVARVLALVFALAALAATIVALWLRLR